MFMYLSKLTQKLYFCIHRNPKFVCINPYLLYYKIHLSHFSQCTIFMYYQNLHRNPNLCIKTYTEIVTSAFTEIQNLCHKSIFKSQNLYFCIHRNPKFVFPYLLYYKIHLPHFSQCTCIYHTLHQCPCTIKTHNFCTSAFTEIQNLCCIIPYLLYYKIHLPHFSQCHQTEIQNLCS